MKDSPNKNDPQADIVFIIEELLDLFNDAEGDPKRIELNSCVGSTFHAHILNVAAHLGLSALGQ